MRTTIPAMTVTALSCSLATGAAAADRVVMPYACTALGSAVELDPSAPRSYDIVSSHSEDTYTHCAPNNPGRCKTWRVHRFDLDCNGTPVPWYKIVAAASELNRGPAFVANGRLRIRMRPSQPGGGWRPRPPDGGGFGDPFGPDEPRERWNGPGADIAVMPSGFAPIIAMEAKLMGNASGPAIASKQPKEAPARGETQKGAPAEPMTPPAKAEPAPKPAAPPAAKKSEPKPPTADSAPEKPAAVTDSGPKPAADDKPAVAAAPQGGPSLDILNAPDRPQTDQTEAVPPPVETAKSPESAAGGVTLPPPGTPAATLLASEAGEGAGSGGAAAQTGAPGRLVPDTNVPGLVAALAALAFLSAAGAILMRKRPPPSRATEAVARDLGAISLAGASGALEADETGAGAPNPPSAAASLGPLTPPELPTTAPAPGSLAAAIETRAAVEWLPSTPEDARHVLGIPPDASAETVLKVVEGLRQSWDPDLARTDEDRRMRQSRTRLIDAAADVLKLRRHAA